MNLLVIVVIIAALWAILFPAFQISDRGSAPGILCMSNVKRLATAMLMYTDSYDAFPPRDRWMDRINPFHKAQDIERCPIVVREKRQGYGYAFNSLLDRRPQKLIENPEKEPMIYDSINYSRNASDPKSSLPNPARHQGVNTVGVADGHAAARRP